MSDSPIFIIIINCIFEKLSITIMFGNTICKNRIVSKNREIYTRYARVFRERQQIKMKSKMKSKTFETIKQYRMRFYQLNIISNTSNTFVDDDIDVVTDDDDFDDDDVSMFDDFDTFESIDKYLDDPRSTMSNWHYSFFTKTWKQIY